MSEEGDRRDSESRRQQCRDPTRLHHSTHTQPHRFRQLTPPTRIIRECRPLLPPLNTTNRRRHTTAGPSATPPPCHLSNTNHAASATPPCRNRPLRWPRTTGLLSSPQEPHPASHILTANLHSQLISPPANSPAYSHQRNYLREPNTAAQPPRRLMAQLARFLSVRRQRGTRFTFPATTATPTDKEMSILPTRVLLPVPGRVQTLACLSAACSPKSQHSKVCYRGGPARTGLLLSR